MASPLLARRLKQQTYVHNSYLCSLEKGSVPPLYAFIDWLCLLKVARHLLKAVRATKTLPLTLLPSCPTIVLNFRARLCTEKSQEQVWNLLLTVISTAVDSVLIELQKMQTLRSGSNVCITRPYSSLVPHVAL